MRTNFYFEHCTDICSQYLLQNKTNWNLQKKSGIIILDMQPVINKTMISGVIVSNSLKTTIMK